MSTSKDYITYLTDLLHGLPVSISFKYMFGEYCIYANDKPIGLVCDDSLFLKALPATECILEGTPMAAPYPGAKLAYKIDIDATDQMRAAIVALEKVVPLPKPKKREQKAAK